MKLIERLLSMMAWLQIFVSPALLGIFVGGAIWLAILGYPGLFAGSIMAIIGCGSGIALAEKARRGKGTVEFISRIIAHPELHAKENNNDPSRIK